MPDRGQHAIDVVSWLTRYVTTVGRDGIIHDQILLQHGHKQQRLWAAIKRATAPMFSQLLEHDAASIGLDTKLDLAGLAVDETLPVLKQLGVNLPAWRRAALLKDYEHLLEFLLAVASNSAGVGDLTALSTTPSSDEQHAPWLTLKRRTAYIEARLRKGQDIPDERFEEVFSTRGQPRRGIL